MNFIAGTILRVFRANGDKASEDLMHQCVLSMLLRHGMNQYFGDGFPKLRLSSLQFDCLVEAYLPDLSMAFGHYNISAEFYATQWFLTLFAYSLPYPHVVRVWDQFLCRGMKFIHRVGLALLSEARPSLLGCSFDITIQKLRSVCQTSQLSPEELVASALEFKVTNRLLSELEQAITAGGASLPCCFLERDLDRGRTYCRFVQAPDTDASEPVAAQSGGTFLEAALPAPRVPTDPLTPELPFPSQQNLHSQSLPSTSKLKSLAKRSKQVFGKVRRPAMPLDGLRGGGGSTSSKADKGYGPEMQSGAKMHAGRSCHARSSSVPLRGATSANARDARDEVFRSRKQAEAQGFRLLTSEIAEADASESPCPSGGISKQEPPALQAKASSSVSNRFFTPPQRPRSWAQVLKPGHRRSQKPASGSGVPPAAAWSLP
eukprot:TRINITY_DN41546_c0_g1_i1.p1 TRINITY_DN41546_c0_g1~~TRINITY_DN41546_c0_g1_i1.p1  ORF type:complete len:431 (-),score=79.94 TRINITY_DN41546_c0_g1_i1:62-1354(-)